MPESLIPIDAGESVSAEDSAGAVRTSINWMVDSSGATILRPAIVNTQLDAGTYHATTGTNTGIIGLTVWQSALDGMPYAVYVRADRYIFAKNLLTNFTVSLSSSDPLTQLAGTAPSVTFSQDTQRLAMAGGGPLQQWTGLNLSSRLGFNVFGVSQPSQAATHVVSVAGYLVANQTYAQTSGQILWSNLGDTNHVIWNPLNFNTADAAPDAVVGIYANLREVAAFGTTTMQIFGIGSDANLPFVASTALAIGCSAPYSPIVYDSQFAWLDETRRFVLSDGRGYEAIGDGVAKLIRDFASVTDCYGFRLRIAYWDLLCWLFPSAQRCYAYDTRSKRWYQWRGWDGVDDYTALRMAVYAYYAGGNMHIVGDPMFENLWTLSMDSGTDSGPGQPIVAELITAQLDNGTAGRKRRIGVRALVKRGLSNEVNGEPLAYLELQKRDDNKSWSRPKRLNLGFAGDGFASADWYPGGIFRRDQYRVRFSSGIPMALTKLVENWEPCEF